MEDDDDDEPPQHHMEILDLNLVDAAGPLHLNETRALAFLRTMDDMEKLEDWYLDTGMSNHMMGCLGAFSNPDRVMFRHVRFDDGSVMEIRHHGTVIFAVRNGERKAFTGVYYIPRSKNSIVSVGSSTRMAPRWRSRMESCASGIGSGAPSSR